MSFSIHRHIASKIIISYCLMCFLLLSDSFAASVPEPQRILEETSKRMIKLFIEKSEDIRKDPEIAHILIQDSLITKINFELMSRWVLGRNWKKASPAQQHEFVRVFKALVIKFYSKGLIGYLAKHDLEEDVITFKPFRGKISSKYVTVRSFVKPPGNAEPVNVDYDLYHNRAGQWQVYDVSIEGISLVTSYRSSFKKIIKEEGMDALLSQLREKNIKLDKSKA
ncbi:MAG: ABC transporter substrate-binding protein [gamma proteobacterium symbiont of Taylorina sp.]|nr:ABC transporter substrate-binding protein [gamma proteobacterium symbiont of Taylorina sp.]